PDTTAPSRRVPRARRPEPRGARAKPGKSARCPGVTMSNSLPTSQHTSAVTDDRYERGLDAYASQFHIARDQVHQWFADRVGGRFAEEAILSAANAWVDDELSLRDRSLVVIAALITKG